MRFEVTYTYRGEERRFFVESCNEFGARKAAEKMVVAPIQSVKEAKI